MAVGELMAAPAGESVGRRGYTTAPIPGKAKRAGPMDPPQDMHAMFSLRRRCSPVPASAPRPLFCGFRLSFLQEPFGELPFALGVELLDFVVEHPFVDGLVPVVERLEAQERRLADELAQHFVGGAHDPAGLS